MRPIILFLTGLVFLTSCKDSEEEPIIFFTPTLPELLISKVYYHSIDLDSTFLIGDYTYNASNQLISRTTYNPTSLLVSITQTYEYENGVAIRCDFSEVTAYNNNFDNPDTTKYYELYSYNEYGFLTSKHRHRGGLNSWYFEYDSDGKIIQSHMGLIDSDYCDSYPQNDTGFDPLLWIEYHYTNDNVTSTIVRRCWNDFEKKLVFDSKRRPSDGLDYIPRTDLLPLISQYGYFSPGLSVGNVTDYGTLRIHEYQYNEKGYPERIIPYYNGQEMAHFEIVYKTPE